MSADPPPPQATDRSAWVSIENKTSHLFKFQVLHQYTGEDVVYSEWKLLKPSEKVKILDKIHYRTGFLTTGVDNWKVHGLKMVETNFENSKGEVIGKIRYLGEPFRSGSGALADWKVHSLRGEDDGKETKIKVFDAEVQWISESGTSTASFFRSDE